MRCLRPRNIISFEPLLSHPPEWTKNETEECSSGSSITEKTTTNIVSQLLSFNFDGNLSLAVRGLSFVHGYWLPYSAFYSTCVQSIFAKLALNIEFSVYNGNLHELILLSIRFYRDARPGHGNVD